MRFRQPSARRAGTVLILFAFLAFVLFALAAIVIDLGLVKATQRQMQTAVDMGALEAVQFPTDDTSASRAVASAYEDGFGRPLVSNDAELTDGIDVGDGLVASQFLNPNKPSYQPVNSMKLNAASTDQTGDVVRGTFVKTDSTPNPEYNSDPNHDPYDRPDFKPDRPPPAATGTDFLVRLRRSNDTLNPATGTNGPPLPYLFGYGSTMPPDARAKGITVRATAIAAPRPALTVGPSIQVSPNAQSGKPGAAPFAITLMSWKLWRESNPTASMLTATIDGSGTISGTVTGVFLARPTLQVFVGQQIVPSLSITARMDQDTYVPVCDTIGSGGTLRVVGFINMTAIAWDPTMPTLTMTINPSLLAVDNASAALTDALDPMLSPADLRKVFGPIADPKYNQYLLQAPALVR